MHKPRVVEVQATSGVFPPQVEAEPIDGLAIAQSLEPLQHHHHRHDARCDRPPTDVPEQVCERLVREQPVTVAVQQSVDRRGRQALRAEPGAGPAARGW